MPREKKKFEFSPEQLKGRWQFLTRVRTVLAATCARVFSDIAGMETPDCASGGKSAKHVARGGSVYKLAFTQKLRSRLFILRFKLRCEAGRFFRRVVTRTSKLPRLDLGSIRP